MLDTSSNASGAKSFLIFVVIVLSGVLVTAVMLNTNDTSGKKQDIRSHASNEADSLVDSDALMVAGEKEVDAIDNDRDLQDTDAATAQAEENAEMAELDAL